MGHEALPGHTCNLPSFIIHRAAAAPLQGGIHRIRVTTVALLLGHCLQNYMPAHLTSLSHQRRSG